MISIESNMFFINRIYIMRVLFLTLLLLLPFGARAELQVDITQGRVQAMPIAITNFYASDDIGNKMASVIRDNLEHSGLFRPLDEKAFIQPPISLANDGPRFSEWKPLNAQALVTGKISKDPGGQYKVEYRLFDIALGTQIDGMAYTTEPSNWRRIAHIISDKIFERLTGEKGYFDTRIVYIAESGGMKKRVKRLAIMDQDGANHRFLTDGSYLVLTPRFSPNAQEIVYMSYANNKPRVYLYNIDTGRQQVLGDFSGMTFSPRFSPDGNSVVMSLSKNGSTNIYTLNLRTKAVRQLTNSRDIDTSPSFSPDGQKIVFESDRGGTQQLYVMNSDGSNPQRITFEKGRYASPVWSPRGDYIAFTKMRDRKFYIGLIKPDGSGERLISTARHVEGPSWAPNGRYLVYFKEVPQGNRRDVKSYVIDVTGFNERMIPTPGDASDPSWSGMN
jgi:TolB protein